VADPPDPVESAARLLLGLDLRGRAGHQRLPSPLAAASRPTMSATGSVAFSNSSSSTRSFGPWMFAKLAARLVRSDCLYPGRRRPDRVLPFARFAKSYPIVDSAAIRELQGYRTLAVLTRLGTQMGSQHRGQARVGSWSDGAMKVRIGISLGPAAVPAVFGDAVDRVEELG